MTAAAVIAAARFGFAARPGELAEIARDPRGWTLAQLGRVTAPLPTLPGSAETVTQILAARARGPDAERELDEPVRRLYLAEAGARLNAALATASPFLERLVHFWSNHFTVSAIRPVVRGLAGAFEREAIRPHVLGRFADMLLAATRHPAMLLYLDNVTSIGPNSPGGRARGKGLNENLGREILELHTLGVDGGYGETDVRALARMLTGWSLARPQDANPGTFMFRPRIHEPGAKTLLGRSYAEDGIGEGEAALRDLARHPATARHIARKLARHFIADEPPEAAVERLATVFRRSDGDLRQVSAALVDEQAVWDRPLAKLRTPADLVIAAGRAVGVDGLPADKANIALRLLDHATFFAPSPAGWPDVAQAWISPEAALRRAEWCQAFAERLPQPPDPIALAQGCLGEFLSAETAAAVRQAPSRRVGLALVLASPEFQRR